TMDPIGQIEQQPEDLSGAPHGRERERPDGHGHRPDGDVLEPLPHATLPEARAVRRRSASQGPNEGAMDTSSGTGTMLAPGRMRTRSFSVVRITCAPDAAAAAAMSSISRSEYRWWSANARRPVSLQPAFSRSSKKRSGRAMPANANAGRSAGGPVMRRENSNAIGTFNRSAR